MIRQNKRINNKRYVSESKKGTITLNGNFRTNQEIRGYFTNCTGIKSGVNYSRNNISVGGNLYYLDDDNVLGTYILDGKFLYSTYFDNFNLDIGLSYLRSLDDVDAFNSIPALSISGKTNNDGFIFSVDYGLNGDDYTSINLSGARNISDKINIFGIYKSNDIQMDLLDRYTTADDIGNINSNILGFGLDYSVLENFVTGIGFTRYDLESNNDSFDYVYFYVSGIVDSLTGSIIYSVPIDEDEYLDNEFEIYLNFSF